jgi:hypothetical protein
MIFSVEECMPMKIGKRLKHYKAELEMLSKYLELEVKIGMLI